MIWYFLLGFVLGAAAAGGFVALYVWIWKHADMVCDVIERSVAEEGGQR